MTAQIFILKKFLALSVLLGADPFHSGFTVEVNVVFCFKSASFSSSNQCSRSCLEMLRSQGEMFTLTSSSERGTGNLLLISRGTRYACLHLGVILKFIFFPPHV